MNCPFCNAPVKDGATFCTSCGAKLPEAPVTEALLPRDAAEPAAPEGTGGAPQSAPAVPPQPEPQAPAGPQPAPEPAPQQPAGQQPAPGPSPQQPAPGPQVPGPQTPGPQAAPAAPGQPAPAAAQPAKKGGRGPIIAIVAAVAAIVVIVAAVFAFMPSGPSVEELIRSDISGQLDLITDPTSDDYREMIEDIDEDGGLSQFGVSTEDFVASMFDGFSYEITSVEVDEEAGTAVAHVSMTVKSFADIMPRFEELLYELQTDPSVIGLGEDELYARVGELMMQAVDETEAKQSDLDLQYYRDSDGAWEEDDSVTDEVASALLS